MKKVDAFTEAHHLYYAPVYGAIFTKVGNAETAKDLCQEVFIKLYEKFDEIESPRKWLFGALRLTVLEYYRKTKNKNLNIDDVFNDVSLTFVNGFRDARIIIAEAIESSGNFADETERALFDMIAVSNLSYPEAGKQLDLTVRQVEYRYGKVVERILDFLKKKGIDNIGDLL